VLPYKKLPNHCRLIAYVASSIYGAPLAFYRADGSIPCADWQVRPVVGLSWEPFGQRCGRRRFSAVYPPFYQRFSNRF
jgi:hypothetical protein